MSHIKTADDIIKELNECENPVTVSSLKTIAISKLKQERDRYRNVVESVLKDFGSDDDGCTANRILNAINEALK